MSGPGRRATLCYRNGLDTHFRTRSSGFSIGGGVSPERVPTNREIQFPCRARPLAPLIAAVRKGPVVTTPQGHGLNGQSASNEGKTDRPQMGEPTPGGIGVGSRGIGMSNGGFELSVRPGGGIPGRTGPTSFRGVPRPTAWFSVPIRRAGHQCLMHSPCQTSRTRSPSRFCRHFCHKQPLPTPRDR